MLENIEWPLKSDGQQWSSRLRIMFCSAVYVQGSFTHLSGPYSIQQWYNTAVLWRRFVQPDGAMMGVLECDNSRAAGELLLWFMGYLLCVMKLVLWKPHSQQLIWVISLI